MFYIVTPAHIAAGCVHNRQDCRLPYSYKTGGVADMPRMLCLECEGVFCKS